MLRTSQLKWPGDLLRLISLALMVCILCFTNQTSQAQTFNKVKDIFAGGSSGISSTASIAQLNGKLYFPANDGANGTELWVSDGSATGTAMLKNIHPTGSSNPANLIVIGSTLYFTATNGSSNNGIELWKTDGTDAGTVMVKDIWTGTSDSEPRFLTNVNGTLYFSASTGSTAPGTGRELWKSDGTDAGTVMVKDINAGTGSSTPTKLTNVNGTLLFAAATSSNGIELWKSDGTDAGTVLVKDIIAGGISSSPDLLTNINGTVYFIIKDASADSVLWKSDGTNAGTVLVKDINPTGASSIVGLTNVNGKLYFGGVDGIHGKELWTSDGTAAGTVMVKDINPGNNADSSLVYTTMFTPASDGLFYFPANNGTNGTELWRSDGTDAGTYMVKDIRVGNTPSIQNVTYIAGSIYFAANDGATGQELWKSDGTDAGTVLVQDVNPGSAASTPAGFTLIGTQLFMTAIDAGGRELWVTDTSAFTPPNANTIAFDVAATDGPKFGQIGFLSSINLTAPADDHVLPLKPYYWRTGRAYTSTGMQDGITLYNRLNNLGVQKQIVILSDFRTVSPTNTIYNSGGAGALADYMVNRAQTEGANVEWDLYNEPNTILRSNLTNFGNLDSFMTAYWIPAYQKIKAKSPGAKIHGPSITINNSDNGGKTDSALIYKFIDAAIASNTLPDYINWHFQIGYNIPEAQNSYVSQMKAYLASKGATVDGFVCGETVRPGDERNTSPGVHNGVFLTAEVYKIPQIHAAWTAQPVYGVRTAEQPVLDGLLANTDGTGKRGVWWTYEFYGRMTGNRIKCMNSNTGIRTLSGLAFRDDAKKEIKLIVGVRDSTTVIGNQTDKSILVGNLNEIPGMVCKNKVHIKAWHNFQTQTAVNGYGTDSLPLVIDAYYMVNAANGGSITIDKPTIYKYGALLIEITCEKEAPTFTRPADITIYTTATCTYDTSVAATGDVTDEADNCSTGLNATYSDATPVPIEGCQGGYTIKRTWRLTDNSGNAATDQVQTITIRDNTAPVISGPSGAPFTRSTNAGQSTYTIGGSEFNATATDNCSAPTLSWSVTGATTISGSGTMANAILNVGVNTIQWMATDACGNTATVTQNVTVTDTENPTIICPANINLSACQSTVTWITPEASDNCLGVTVAQTGGPAPGSTFANGTTTTITYTATDAAGNQQSCSFTVTKADVVTVSGSNSNPRLYFGYAGDQSATISATATGGGVGPYTISITMSRPLKCNYINDAGDESWTSAGSTINNSCSANPGLATLAPVSTFTNVSEGGSLSVNVTLLADADITATVTDANGCTATYTTHIDADDVRCFAGNSGNAKITMCHPTGSAKNPYVAICVDSEAVNEHLQQGDWLGSCTNSTANRSVQPAVAQIQAESLSIQAWPNPSDQYFTLRINGSNGETATIKVFDIHGRQLYSNRGPANINYRFGESFTSGTYIVEVKKGKEQKTIRVVKGN